MKDTIIDGTIYKFVEGALFRFFYFKNRFTYGRKRSFAYVFWSVPLFNKFLNS